MADYQDHPGTVTVTIGGRGSDDSDGLAVTATPSPPTSRTSRAAR